MIVPIIVYITEQGFSASIVGLKYSLTCYPSYEELSAEFCTAIESGIEGLKEECLKIPTSEEVQKELMEEISIQDLEEFYKIEFVNYHDLTA